LRVSFFRWAQAPDLDFDFAYILKNVKLKKKDKKKRKEKKEPISLFINKKSVFFFRFPNVRILSASTGKKRAKTARLLLFRFAEKSVPF
jgi:hypothetical protein